MARPRDTSPAPLIESESVGGEPSCQRRPRSRLRVDGADAGSTLSSRAARPSQAEQFAVAGRMGGLHLAGGWLASQAALDAPGNTPTDLLAF